MNSFIGGILESAKKNGLLGNIVHGGLTLLIGDMTPEKKEKGQKILAQLEAIGVNVVQSAAKGAAEGAVESLKGKLS